MKSVLISIKPKWCELIVSGKKTVEVRKTKPKIETPFKCYIYCTYGEGLIEANDEFLPNHLIEQKVSKHKTWGNCCNGKVIGEFVCDKIYQYSTTQNCKGVDITDEEITIASCLTKKEIEDYEFSAEAKDFCIYKIGVYGWHISDLVIYGKPRELSEFKKPCNHKNDCCTCDRYDYIGHRCYDEITRPPQSWCYVESEGEG